MFFFLSLILSFYSFASFASELSDINKLNKIDRDKYMYNQITQKQKDQLKRQKKINREGKSNFRNYKTRKLLYKYSYETDEDMPTHYIDNYHLTLFYALSAWQFTEESDDYILSTRQNSPVTLGWLHSYDLSKRSQIENSLYYSKVEVANQSSDIDTDNFVIPSEIGITAYYKYKFYDTLFALHTGFDYEKFSIFNTSEVIQGEELDILTYKILFYTVGAANTFKYSELDLLLKLGVSQSIYNSYSREKVTNERTKMDGVKFILYSAINFKSNLSFSVFYKQHLLETSGDISITRFGLGISYQFL